MSLIRTPPSALLLLGLPLATSFGTIARLGSSVDLTVENTGGSGGFRPDPALFPEDACQHLTDGTIKIITEENEWCGKYSGSPDDCSSEAGPLRLKLRLSKLSTIGSVVAYDICTWDSNFTNDDGSFGKCRLASLSYFCHNSCPGVPADRARSDKSAIEITTKTKKIAVPAVGGVYGSFEAAVVPIVEQVLLYGGRRLAVSDPLEKITKPTTNRRKMQASECTTMEDGGLCCEAYEDLDVGIFFDETIEYPITIPEQPAPVITVGSKPTPTEAPLEGLAYSRFQNCTYFPPSTCTCSVVNGEPVAQDLCEDGNGPPFIWGSQGRRLGRAERTRAERLA